MTTREHLQWSRRAFLSTSGRAAASMFAAGFLPRWQAPARVGVVSLERTVVAMGTTVSIVSFGDDRAHLVEATGAAFAELYRLDRTLSVFIPTSDISRLNNAEIDEPVEVQGSTLEALRAAGGFTELTGGGFDATVGGLLSVWGFHRDAGTTQWPSEREISEAKSGIGWRHLRIGPDGTVRRMRRATKVDLGGIGAGFAVDRMGEILRRRGIEAALIDHSGDLLAIGAPPEADGWLVSIPDPAATDRSLRQLSLRDRAVSTSTNVRSVRRLGAKTVGHIIEPRTGENPRQQVSVSVLAPSSTEADALSTALFVNAQTDGAWNNGEREAIFVRPEGRDYHIETVR